MAKRQMAVTTKRPARGGRQRLCFVGPMLGRNPGWVTTQGEILSDLFEAEGYPVISVSTRVGRLSRLADIASTLLRRRREIDLVCIQVFSGPSFVVTDIASRISKLLGKPIVMCLRGGALPEFMERYPRWAQRVFRRGDAFVAPSHYLARALEQRGFEVRVIPNVIDLSAYPYRHRRRLRPRLLWMRTFHPAYNPALALRVLARLRESVPEATLVMAGQEKGLGEEMRRLAETLGVSDAVRFAGFLDRAGKQREAAEADIFLNTNQIDNMPVSVVEACAFGLPVVATAVGGVPDLLTHEETGLLVPDDDTEAMVAAIRRLLDEPELAAHLSASGRVLAERSSWPQVRQELEEVFGSFGGRQRAGWQAAPGKGEPV